jgi:hypothetical protein
MLKTLDPTIHAAITIPMSQKRPDVPLYGGDSFVYTHKCISDAEQDVHFSSLQFLPGKDVVVTRPMIWASQTASEKVRARRGGSDDGPSEDAMSALMKGVKTKLVEKALSMNRSNNAILGVQFHVVRDSIPYDTFAVGFDMVSKQFTVVASGAPCTVVESQMLGAPTTGSSSPQIHEHGSTIPFAEAVALS